MRVTATSHSGRGSDAGLAQVGQLASQLRADSIRASTVVVSGHPTSSLSAADLMAVLLARHLHYDWQRPDLTTNDHLIFSKGHASPLLYAMFEAAGVVSDEELVGTYRRCGARLQRPRAAGGDGKAGWRPRRSRADAAGHGGGSMSTHIGERLLAVHNQMGDMPLPEQLEGASCGPAVKHLAHLAMHTADVGGSEADWKAWVHRHVPEVSEQQIAAAEECMQTSGLWPWHASAEPATGEAT